MDDEYIKVSDQAIREFHKKSGSLRRSFSTTIGHDYENAVVYLICGGKGNPTAMRRYIV